MKKALIKKEGEVRLPSKYGDFNLHAYSLAGGEELAITLSKGVWEKDDPV